MSKAFDLKNPDRLVHVGVILPNGLNETLDVAPVDALYAMSKEETKFMPDDLLPPHLKAQAFDIKFHWVSETGKAPARLTSGINLIPTDSYESCPPLDIVLIGAQDMVSKHSEADLAFIRKSFAGCSAFITICGGVMAPMQAGILQGKSATGPRIMLQTLRQTNPGVDWQEKRWVRDGKLWTSGALLNGADLMNAFCQETWGGEGTLWDFISKLGSWPARDVNYKDGP
ncbi:hypothetical protein DL766_008467 [Monosporascus sp. MC13-8B]|uniref:DJ-1/PfpI domain-containing protein n=1 Tax=Monosporascus cannonballus TaxID=155416 RepID=A0ABY0H3U8_9PEZI|nr:hypothetical protein DL762_006180 [Monosporascus cannonballus]RYO88951.1 hypothetical protein DL763_005811 [Monosporascus cannonballus]RYP19359.1 hypothetical protein DL766_008467 [Monosporascus sp. MC13-8B]